MSGNGNERIGIKRNELAEVKRREMSSKFRRLLGPIPCLFGIHNWGPPKARNSVTLRGERDEDGEWDHWTEDPTKNVSQYCQSCPKRREREDLDWQTLADIQAGRTAPYDTREDR
jgi:hypothetical protein